MSFKCALIYVVESALLMNTSLKPEVLVYDATLFSGGFFFYLKAASLQLRGHFCL